MTPHHEVPDDARKRETDHNGEADCERDHDVGQHLVGPVQPVHHRLDDLEHRERGDAVADQRAEDAPALQLCKQGEVHPCLRVQPYHQLGSDSGLTGFSKVPWELTGRGPISRVP